MSFGMCVWGLLRESCKTFCYTSRQLLVESGVAELSCISQHIVCVHSEINISLFSVVCACIDQIQQAVNYILLSAFPVLFERQGITVSFV
jgi:hypothetical protein